VNSAQLLDTTIFTLELVHAQSNAILQVLDSVVVAPRSGSMMPTFSGNDVRSVLHATQIQTKHAGETVFIRAVPYRYGPTPHRMYAYKERSFFNLSMLYRDMQSSSDHSPVKIAPTNVMPRRFDPLFSDTCYTAYLNAIVSYWDEDTSRKCLPAVFDLLIPQHMDSVWRDMLEQRKYHHVQNPHECIHEWALDSSAVYELLDTSTISLLVNKPFINTVANTVAQNVSIEFAVRSKLTEPCVIMLYGYSGTCVQDVWQGIAPQKNISVPLALTKGVYILVAHTESGAYSMADLWIQ
jgi:hypothetical protein